MIFDNLHATVSEFFDFRGFGKNGGESAQNPRKHRLEQDFASKTFENTILRAFCVGDGVYPGAAIGAKSRQNWKIIVLP